MKRYFVHFQPIEVSKEEAEELSTSDPNGNRIDLEMQILKRNCPIPVFTVQKREQLPVISNITVEGEL